MLRRIFLASKREQCPVPVNLLSFRNRSSDYER